MLDQSSQTELAAIDKMAPQKGSKGYFRNNGLASRHKTAHFDARSYTFDEKLRARKRPVSAFRPGRRHGRRKTLHPLDAG